MGDTQQKTTYSEKGIYISAGVGCLGRYPVECARSEVRLLPSDYSAGYSGGYSGALWWVPAVGTQSLAGGFR